VVNAEGSCRRDDGQRGRRLSDVHCGLERWQRENYRNVQAQNMRISHLPKTQGNAEAECGEKRYDC
jgi:nitrate reductase cytochrome c-type subunit